MHPPWSCLKILHPSLSPLPSPVGHLVCLFSYFSLKHHLQLLPGLAGKHVDKTLVSWQNGFFLCTQTNLLKANLIILFLWLKKQLVFPYLLDKILMRHRIRIIYHLSRFITPSSQNPCPHYIHTHTHTHTELTIHSNRTLCLSHSSPGSFMPPCLGTNYCLECFVLFST